MKTIPDINTVREIVELLKRANVEPYALLSEAASCLGVKKTVLMAYIQEKSDLFVCVQVTHGKRNLGLGIKDVYTRAEDNPYTEAWLESARKAYARTIFITQVWEYGDSIRDEYVKLDSKPYSSTLPASHQDRPWEWRNTRDKIEALQASGHCTEDFIGWGYNKDSIYRLSVKDREALKADGWSFKFI